VQNQRVKDRAFFTAPDGRVIVGSDKDQLELRLAAVLAGVREILEEVAKPDGDPHRLAAVNIYGKAFFEKTAVEQKRLRDAVKTTVYASLYRAGVKTVHKSIRKKKFLDTATRAALTLRVVGHIYHSYFGKYVEIPIWHDKNVALAESQGYLEIPPLGRRRYFPVQPVPFTEVANWPIQTCGSDIVGMQMIEIQDELDRRFHGDASMILHGHDALYIECAERHAEETKKVVDAIFGHYVLEGPAGKVDLTAQAKIGRSLLECK
jgi:DNA polymerase I-like protein with 3'-5' exonuclease and polymerase domains